jgi:uncharacterized protein (TIGR02594 family)
MRSIKTNTALVLSLAVLSLSTPALAGRAQNEPAANVLIGTSDERTTLAPEPAPQRKPRSSHRKAAALAPRAEASLSWSSDVVTEARRWIGTNPTDRSSLWCARFMNFVLERTGRRGTGSDAARSFASYGHRVPGPQVGAIAVLTRGANGGHVGVVSGVDPSGNPIIISGNHNKRVAEAVYPRGRIIAYVMPM